MEMRAHSTIQGISILSNSVQGLDFLNWRRVYNALVIPMMTYGIPVWYTGIGQKGLIQHLQVAQNEGLRKISGTFHITPIEPLHNLTAIPPISYLIPKLMDAYSHRLGSMNPVNMTHTVTAKMATLLD
jgi:hypothetical protein